MAEILLEYINMAASAGPYTCRRSTSPPASQSFLVHKYNSGFVNAPTPLCSMKANLVFIGTPKEGPPNHYSEAVANQGLTLSPTFIHSPNTGIQPTFSDNINGRLHHPTEPHPCFDASLSVASGSDAVITDWGMLSLADIPLGDEYP